MDDKNNKNDMANNVINLTILLGNGFDLNLGLQTSYKSFVEIYKKENLNDSEEVKKIKELLKNDDFNWCDLEEKMGEYTSKYNSAIEFSIAHNDIGEKLQNYLIKEEENFMKKLDDTLCIRFIDSIMTIISNYVAPLYMGEKWENKKICINFVVFNYTMIVDNLVNKIVNNDKLKEKIYKNCTFEKINHCHGTLYSKMCFGVDNSSQISNEEIFDEASVRYKQELIKPEYNRIIKMGFDTSAKEIINKSNVIVSYGCSFGNTDRTWINEISMWLGNLSNNVGFYNYLLRDELLKENIKRKFIIFSFKEPKNNFFGTSGMVYEDSVKKKFTYSDDTWIDIAYGNMFVALKDYIKG